MRKKNLGKKIVLIDDDKDQTDLYSHRLRLDGFEVCTENRPLEAMSLVLKEKPDLIILDIIMDDLDGIALLKQFKTSTKTVHIPVVMLTNTFDPEQVEQVKVMGAKDYWQKTQMTPISMSLHCKDVLHLPYA